MTIFVPVIMVLTLSGCENGPSAPSGDDKGTLRVLMHDAPGDFEELWVDIQRVEVNNLEDADQGWIVINEPDERYDLLELINGAHVVLGEEELEPGTYRQIRLILGEDNSIIVNGEEQDIKVPSGSQTGLKLNIDADIEPAITYTLLLDFDARRSVVTRGQGQGTNPSYLLKPVIRATSEADAGNIAGEVEPVDAHPWIYAIAEEDTLSSTRADEESGEFMLMSLEEGTYDVAFEPVEGYEETTIGDVEVEAGETTEFGTVEISEEEENNE